MDDEGRRAFPELPPEETMPAAFGAPAPPAPYAPVAAPAPPPPYAPVAAPAPSTRIIVPPGWYPDPAGEKTYRFWNGAAWTEAAGHAAEIVGPRRRARRRSSTRRRVLWNLYAVPFSLLLVTSVVTEVHDIGWFAFVDVAVSAPTLLALHLHIWDKRVLSRSFWRPYAFFAVAWDIVFNALVAPTLSGQRLGLGDLAGALVFVPLYVALFRYAFRRWQPEPSAPDASAAAVEATQAPLSPPPRTPARLPRFAGPPPGWYPDPAGVQAYRYWDGVGWTARVAQPDGAALGYAFDRRRSLPAPAVEPPPPLPAEAVPAPAPFWAPAPSAATMLGGPERRGRRIAIGLAGLAAPAMIGLFSLMALVAGLSGAKSWTDVSSPLHALYACLGLALAAALIAALGIVTLRRRVSARAGLAVIALTLVPLGVALQLALQGIAAAPNGVLAASLLVIAGMALVRLGPVGRPAHPTPLSPAAAGRGRFWRWLALPGLAGPAMAAGGGLLGVTAWWSYWAALPSGPDGGVYAGGLLVTTGPARWLSLLVMALGLVAGLALTVAVAFGVPRRPRLTAAALAAGLAVVFLVGTFGGRGLDPDWAGYAATGGPFTTVTATWTQPAVPTGHDDRLSSSFWVGLDGYGDATVEQIGTTLGGDVWYEMYPRPVKRVGLVAAPGDVLTATVTRRGPHVFELKLVDHTSGARFATTKTGPHADAVSAEVVAEAQWYDKTPFGGFDRVRFSRCTVDGLPLSVYGPERLDVHSGRLARATRSSSLDTGGTAFAVARVTSRPSLAATLRAALAHALPHDEMLFLSSLSWLLAVVIVIALRTWRGRRRSSRSLRPSSEGDRLPGDAAVRAE